MLYWLGKFPTLKFPYRCRNLKGILQVCQLVTNNNQSLQTWWNNPCRISCRSDIFKHRRHSVFPTSVRSGKQNHLCLEIDFAIQLWWKKTLYWNITQGKIVWLGDRSLVAARWQPLCLKHTGWHTCYHASRMCAHASRMCAKFQMLNTPMHLEPLYCLTVNKKACGYMLTAIATTYSGRKPRRRSHVTNSFLLLYYWISSQELKQRIQNISNTHFTILIQIGSCI